MAPSGPPGTVLEDCLRVRQSGAIRVLVALVRMIQDLWARASTMWLHSFVLLPRILGCWGSFARAFLPGRLVLFSLLLHALLLPKPPAAARLLQSSLTQ